MNPITKLNPILLCRLSLLPSQMVSLSKSRALFFLCLLRGFDADDEASGVGIYTKDSSSSLVNLE